MERTTVAATAQSTPWLALTSVRVQGHDDAALLHVLGLPAAAFGVSSRGGMFADLLLRRPEPLTVAASHEPGWSR